MLRNIPEDTSTVLILVFKELMAHITISKFGVSFPFSYSIIIIIIIIISFMELGHLLTRSGLTYPEVSSKVYHDSFCQLGSGISSPASFRETCQWLKFPLNGLPAQSRVSAVVGLLPLASGPACLGMAFPPFLVKQLYRCDSVVIFSFVRTGYTTRR